jgi:hypothetical protein
MSVALQRALAAETHLANDLTLKLRLTTKIEKSLIILVGICKLTVRNMEEQLILFLKNINKKNGIKMFPSGMKC